MQREAVVRDHGAARQAADGGGGARGAQAAGQRAQGQRGGATYGQSSLFETHVTTYIKVVLH